MPIYDFLCKDCNTSFEVSCKISERTQGIFNCPNCSSSHIVQQILKAPLRGASHRLGHNRKHNEFKDVLRTIHKRTPGSTLDQATDLGG